MTLLLQDEVYDKLRRRNLIHRQARIGSAIAMCEAPTVKPMSPPRCDSTRVGDKALANATWGFSYNVFQIRSLREHSGTGKYRDAERLDEVPFAFDSAVTIFGQSGWLPWSTFVSRKFEAYLPDLFPVPDDMYMVVAGDTLSGIAAKIGGFTWQDLARENGLHEPYAIDIGMKLLLPD